MGYVAGMAIAAQKAAAFTVPVISPATCWPEARRVGAGMDMDTTSYDRRSHIARRGFGEFHYVSRRVMDVLKQVQKRFNRLYGPLIFFSCNRRSPQIAAGHPASAASRAAAGDQPLCSSERTDRYDRHGADPDREAPDGRRTAIAGGANPRVTVVACGGTIASEPDDGGAAPAKTGDDLVAAVPGIERYAAVSAREVCSQPGFDVRWRDVLATATAAREAVADGADGVVVTTGPTPSPIPRSRSTCSPTFPHRWSSRGPAPTRRALQRRAREPDARGPGRRRRSIRAGVHVAFDDEIHAARDVVKGHSNALSTMTSPGTGPVATVTRAGSRLVREPRRGVDIDPLVDGIESADVVPEVPVIHSGTGVSAGAVERAVDAGVCGLVIEGTGLGNATAAIGDAVADVLPEVPVVVAGRPPAGPTEPVYGTPGGAVTLAEHGVTFAAPSRRRRRGSRSHSDSRPTSTATGKRATPMPTPSPTCSGRRKGKIDRRNTGKRSCLRETLMRAPRSDGRP